MKKIIALLLLLIAALPSVAEVIKYKATSFALNIYDYDAQSWTDWSDWQECNILVVVDAGKDLITVYSQETQEQGQAHLLILIDRHTARWTIA